MKQRLLLALALLPVACTFLTAQKSDSTCALGLFIPTEIGTTIVPNVVPPDPDVTPPLPTGPDDYRNITWVHGLGGTFLSWSEAATATQSGPQTTSPMYGQYPAREVVSYVPTYSETSLQAAALTLRNTMVVMPPASPGGNYERDFIIAHSQGGLVSRMLDKMIAEGAWGPNEVRKVNGIVTFGTPHGGARILNSRDEGLIYQFAADACENFLNPTVYGVVADAPGILGFFVEGSDFEPQVNDLCNTLGNTVLPLFLGKLTVGSTDDFKVGAPVLGELNAYGNPGIPKVAITGVEYGDGEDPIDPKQLLWRSLYSFNEANNGPAFSKDADQELVDAINNRRARYTEKIEEYEAEVDNWQYDVDYFCNWPLWVLMPGAFASCQIAQSQLNDAQDALFAYRRGAEWLDDSNDQWKIIIGATEYSTNTYECVCEVFGGEIINGVVNDPADCPGDEQCYARPVITPSVYPSDGVVNDPTQLAFPGAQATHRMEQMNHFQMRNAIETARTLNKLFDGEFGIFFRTNAK